MILGLMIVLAIQLPQDLHSKRTTNVAARATPTPQPKPSLMTSGVNSSDIQKLAIASREELMIVDRLHSLRLAVENLPQNWKATGLKSLPTGVVLSKENLLSQIEQLELSAAERWTVLLENSALIDGQAVSTAQHFAEVRKELDDLKTIHADVNSKLDQFNSTMKDGILMNLASKAIDGGSRIQ